MFELRVGSHWFRSYPLKTMLCFNKNYHYIEARILTEIKIHWSFWAICVVALIWNIMGSINFIMQMDSEMVENFPEEARSLIASRPLWATIAFAFAVFGGVLAEVFLLLKKATAYYLFIISLLGIIITNVHTFQVSSAMSIWAGILMSFVMAIFLISYTKIVQRKAWIN